MGIMMKGEKDLLTLRAEGDGPIGGLLVTADSKGDVKGYAFNPEVMLPPNAQGKLDVGGALGVGVLSVIRDIGLKEPYVGQTILVSGEIAEDLTAYYFISEQQNTAISLGVKIDTDYSVLAAGGMIIQMLPNAEEEAITALETMLAGLPPITTLVEEAMEACGGKDASQEKMLAHMLQAIFTGMPEDYQVRPLELRDLR